MLSTRKAWLAGIAMVAATFLASAPARAIEPDKMIPADAEAVVVFNVRQTLDSPLIKTYALDKIKEGMKSNAQAETVLKAAGIDPLKDIDSVLVTNAGITPKNQVLIVTHGKFDLDKVHAAAADFSKKNPTELKFTGDGKGRIYEFVDKDNTVFANFPDASTLIATNSKEYLQKALKKETGAALNKALGAALEKIKGGKESLWMAAIVTDEMRKQLEANPQTKALAPKLESMTGSVNVNKDIDLSFAIHTADADTAKTVAKQINGVKPLLALLAGGNEEIKPIIDLLTEKLTIRSDEKATSINLNLTEDELKKVLPKGSK